MKYFQKELSLKPRTRGFHLITRDIIAALPELGDLNTGLLHVHIKHTSASLTINENADPTVREDFETHFNLLVSEEENHYQHTFEGPDDMTSHIKASLLGPSVTIPVTKGHLNLGVWQGVYLCEHRNHGGSRKLVLTLHGT
ncbi:secondary thiamine-phosphate synthase [Roseivirga sp. 4D4]|uniref:secondary thiamine-phosphate synthase enzyme YjbQ n=1 Tax=Roseivirga sp. 4D4 TaxID=1889784 RepID=UPI000853D4EE|nr:secondary thiamine-phosphate synthase enzyme YjbQ [Roseivirga sp. 4D4]OEK02687.1 secondary thiamine-phosphate synthase [Roseivirga sp. 4D4]